MLGVIRRRWHRAQALSALQLHWGLPLKEPLDTQTAGDLDAATRLMIEAGGTPYDTAVAFLALRLESRIRLGTVEDGVDLGFVTGRAWNARDHMKLWDTHMATFKRLSELVKKEPSHIA